ncbi:Rieske 2Fe-2S domain-containing protein [Paenibacillus oenotherae]|uniref:Rieske 2Fe-2S domain-containing protein n=1 Tax=Paenibacillus oenotherae TaxID=1435645 RepID=A0ABS7D586_9BACL|nr:Rieske 2Fe-2S domain-containing protein [Paenibacillus oenotherae]MBW7474636.1 Rieske 2Fe-2S domain-containing protein [Paenibacillus oenotherae]
MSYTEEQHSGYKVVAKVEDITSFPAAVELDNAPYFIVDTTKANDGQSVYKLVAATCPHIGGVMRPQGDELICPLHFWSFDIETGESTNIPGEQVSCQPIVVHDGLFTIANS